jgi:tryptophan synthase alpha chain
MLEAYLRQRLQHRPILLMTHIVLGYPDFETSVALVEGMAEVGVDLVELQIPFSEPIADGPVILHANQRALMGGARVERCFEMASMLAARVSVPLLFMSYYNVLFKQGIGRFVSRMHRAGVRGAIVPDLPPEEADEYLAAMHTAELDPIFIVTPTTSPQRMELLGQRARGFVYCVARKGVTGSQTDFSQELSSYLARARAAIPLPLAVGFGVKSRRDVEFLQGKAQIAVVGSETLRALDAGGVGGALSFLRGLS